MKFIEVKQRNRRSITLWKYAKNITLYDWCNIRGCPLHGIEYKVRFLDPNHHAHSQFDTIRPTLRVLANQYAYYNNIGFKWSSDELLKYKRNHRRLNEYDRDQCKETKTLIRYQKINKI